MAERYKSMFALFEVSFSKDPLSHLTPPCMPMIELIKQPFYAFDKINIERLRRETCVKRSREITISIDAMKCNAMVAFFFQKNMVAKINFPHEKDETILVYSVKQSSSKKS